MQDSGIRPAEAVRFTARRGGAFFAAIVALLIASVVVGWFIYAGLEELDQPRENVGWAIYQLGLEHQRLQLAAETGGSEKDIRLRGELYLSRVLLIRDAPAYEALRQSEIGAGLQELVQTAEVVQSLIGGIDKLSNRDALIARVRQDAEIVRKLTFDLAMLDRSQQAEQRRREARRLNYLLMVLESLLAAMLLVTAWAWRINDNLGRAGQQLAMKSQDLDAILNSVGDGILGVDSAGTVIYCSARAAALLKWEDIPVSGEPLARLPSSPVCEAAVAVLASPQEGHAMPKKLTVENGGELRHFALNASIARYAGAKPGYALRIITISDVTSQEEARRKQDDYDARIGEISRLLTLATISGGIVHEISQPLSSIKNYIHLLKRTFADGNNGEESARYLANLNEEIERVADTVRNVRRMALDHPMEIGSCDLREALRNSLRLASLGRADGSEVACRIPGHEIRIVGSLPLIGQVLVNLIRNAIEASERAAHPGVEITVNEGAAMAAVSVRDFGKGLDPAIGERMFHPFLATSSSGMGLGLAISKRIADSVGGELEWTNLQGGGARFTFRVPLAKS